LVDGRGSARTLRSLRLRAQTQNRESPDFGAGSAAHQFLAEHITVDVASYVGVELKRKRKISWSSVILALAIGLPLAYWTYRLNQDHFAWISLLPGLTAALMLMAALGMLFGDEADPQQDQAESLNNGKAEHVPADNAPVGSQTD
jgi:hypothetical protein